MNHYNDLARKIAVESESRIYPKFGREIRTRREVEERITEVNVPGLLREKSRYRVIGDDLVMLESGLADDKLEDRERIIEYNDSSGILCVSHGGNVETLRALYDRSSGSSAKRRASHEGTGFNGAHDYPYDSARARSSPSRRRHSQGSVMSSTPTNATWGGLGGGISMQGSCETTLTDIMESPVKSQIILGRNAVPIINSAKGRNMSINSSIAPEPFGTPCAVSPIHSPLPILQDEYKKDSLNSDEANENEDEDKMDKSLDGEGFGADIDEGHTSREGLDPESLMFRDGRRRIDMVIAYEQEDLGVMTEAEARRCDQRKVFQANLIKEGLELELENRCLSFDEKTWFLKVHIPWKTEARYAEVMSLKLPTKRFITISVRAWDKNKSQKTEGRITMLMRKLHALLDWDHSLIPQEPSFYRSIAPSDGGREEQFLVKDRQTSYTSAQRSLLVMQILLRAKYDSTEKVGIRRLLNDGTYTGCFPLHEGRYDKAASNGEMFDRHLLYLEWARPSKWFKKQPLWLVRKYFGDRIGLYFCWLGFYTKMLYAPALVGTLCFLYGVLSMDSDDNIPSKEICDESISGNLDLCPSCDKACKYQKLHESCLFAKMTYLFDNPATVFFAIFMSFWATSFLELWKRKQSIIVWEWDLHGVDQDEEPRPEFETSVKTFRINPVTREKEPYLPTWSRALRFVATGSAVFFMISVVLGAVLGTIIYRLSVVSVIYGAGDTGGNSFVQSHAKIFTSITAAMINLIIIMILTRVYANIAIHLTNLENPRTQIEYEDSYTFKIFFFEFMNFYSSLIYIAFFKGRFFDYPGDVQARKTPFLKLKGDVCDPAGCLSELCIQLAIIMIGKQCFNNFLEILYPKMWNWWRQRTHRAHTKDKEREHQAWEQDYHLQDPGRLALFDEYLEMILQYGFVTLFVAAFPLAPLFALLNNVAEIRLDAYKMVTQARRPLAERIEDIGAWYGILRGITYASVVSNAFVIAYTSDYIPRMVYRLVYSKNSSLIGYINHSLSTFNTSDYRSEWGLEGEKDPPTCQYRGYRKGPNDEDQYGLSPHYWHVFAARLAFVVVFEHIVFGLTGMMQYAIPDTPAELRTQRQRESLLAKEAKYEVGQNDGPEGARVNGETDYRRLLRHVQHPPTAGVGAVGSWARRLSRVSDALDAHITEVQRPKYPIVSPRSNRS